MEEPWEDRDLMFNLMTKIYGVLPDADKLTDDMFIEKHSEEMDDNLAQILSEVFSEN